MARCEAVTKDGIVLAAADTQLELAMALHVQTTAIGKSINTGKDIALKDGTFVYFRMVYPIRVCQCCGKSFEDRSKTQNRVACSPDCKAALNRDYCHKRWRTNKAYREAAQFRARAKEYNRRESELRSRMTKSAEKQERILRDDNRKAKKDGISYGEWRARQDPPSIDVSSLRKRISGENTSGKHQAKVLRKKMLRNGNGGLPEKEPGKKAYESGSIWKR